MIKQASMNAITMRKIVFVRTRATKSVVLTRPKLPLLRRECEINRTVKATDARADVITTTANQVFNELATQRPGDVEAPIAVVVLLAFLIGLGFFALTTFGLKPGSEAQSQMKERDQSFFNKKK